jgi:hypothetical protein
VGHDVLWEVVGDRAEDSLELATSGLAFYRSNIPAENSVRVDGVLLVDRAIWEGVAV